MQFLKSSLFIFSAFLILGCKEQPKTDTKTTYNQVESVAKKAKLPAFKTNKQFNDYWYSGQAEITSYQLEQSRYGEIRKGTAVLVFVTEPFLENDQVKADQSNPSNINVLKLNATKKFNTGIYPYSIMQSTFYPVSNNQHALKVSASVQEWCGHVYTQLNNREQFQVTSHSYFQGEADQNFNLEKNSLENQLWTQLRIDPTSLPTGKINIIPSLEYTRLNHTPLKAYNAFAENKPGQYTLTIKDLDRKLTINYNPNFPFDIQSWEEVQNGNLTKATKIKTLQSDYWNKKSNTDLELRKTLGLE
ncbi:septum formation inhibitor Maf [Olleya sp. UBA1516]|uniref:septum formation inhibitor Maf n=1 Tax=Olleya sp. UBA1516 TaxID=1947013 RepID=UPI0025E55C7E|nr:septum formation inhibitor Maf [Olleya sp. UBA1516]|tara:strand:- start:754 stop:1662 length:909 start_codon:yes stop_codon:yes gene_type:complete